MQVDVFISMGGDGDTPFVLVLPADKRVPRHLARLRWRQLAITSPSDRLLGNDPSEIEVGLAEDGYALVRPTGRLLPKKVSYSVAFGRMRILPQTVRPS